MIQLAYTLDTRPRAGLYASLVAGIVLSSVSLVSGQSILDDNLPVTTALAPLDRLIREQLERCFRERDAAEAAHGRNSAEWFAVSDRHDPLVVHGQRILRFAREHPRTPESLACLSYIIDWGEGRPTDLCRLACAELLAIEKDNPALSWVCSRCTNALYLEPMESFLRKLAETSNNQTVQAAATYHLAALYDNAAETRRELKQVREHLGSAGMTKAQPELAQQLDFLERRSFAEYAARRDELLQLVIAKKSQVKPWTATRTFGRLNYSFGEDSKQTSHGELAERLSFGVQHLRAGCVPPDFQAPDVDGRLFSLAEYRGQSVLLMFSFKGCGACEAMYPALRKVQERFSPRGFAIIGVMADEGVETIRQAKNAGDITWRCIWDGSSGPIARLYQVDSFPTVLLIDGKGRIVSSRLRGEEELAAAIENAVNGRQKN